MTDGSRVDPSPAALDYSGKLDYSGALSYLRAAGCSVLLDSRGGRLPAVLHWGTDLGPLTAEILENLEISSRAPVGDSLFDVPERVSLLPTPAEGWVGTPGLSGSRAGADFSPLFRVIDEVGVDADEQIAGGRRIRAVDQAAALELDLQIELMCGGLLRTQATLTNAHRDQVYDLLGLCLCLPVPSEADELFDLTGRHTRERQPQRTAFNVGTHLRESRKGKPGLDASYLLAAGRAGFGFTSAQIWGVHLGWSGNQTVYAEKTYNGQRLLGAGELLLPGEIRLAPGASYRSPWVYAAYGNGLNEVAARFHEFLRARPGHPRSVRKVVVNTWEAVYFQQDFNGLLALAEAAASVGVERFVLDDGWFRGRRNDRAGLGDWFVDATIWPHGLSPLIEKVHDLGMDFGLWVEPEMINLDSDLAREHPEWIFRAGGRDGLPSRYQHVLDLGHPAAYEHIAARLHALLDAYPIAYLKWDHNRMVVEAGHQPTGTPGVHAHTLAVYRLLEELRTRHPGLEIESCAGGGGRIDLGILQHTDRVWPSDCIDALERQQIQRYTALLVPPEMVGTHLGSPHAHSTGRVHQLDFRAATAIWGHLGIEWNLAGATDEELKRVRAWVDLHKQLRSLLHTGTVIVTDHPDPAIWVNGVTSTDRSEAVYGITSVSRSVTWPPGRVRLPGLDPHETYLLRPIQAGDGHPEASAVPHWWSAGITLTGRMLAEVGVQIPAMHPEHIHLLHAAATQE